MDFADLEIFCAVAAEHSITRAAQRLGRVQSNVTTRIKHLEETLHASLFLRDSKRMVLTAQGRQFLSYAEKLLALAEEARQSLHPETPGGCLRVGTMESTAASRLPKPLARYHVLWPQVDLRITTGTTGALVEAVLARQLDCALIAQLGDVPLEPGLRGTHVFSEELLLVLPASHPEVRGPGDVTLDTLASFAVGCAYRRAAQAWLASDGHGPGRHLKVLEVASYHGILACVAAGACMALVPRSIIDLQRELLDVRLHSVMTLPTLLVCRASYRTPAYEAFEQVLRQTSEHSATGSRQAVYEAARPHTNHFD